MRISLLVDGDGHGKGIEARAMPVEQNAFNVYVFGDEFTGKSIDSVVESVDRINKEDAQGNRLVRIHGVGFPVMFSQRSFSENTGVRFATLMRILCQKNGGAFVGLTWNR